MACNVSMATAADDTLANPPVRLSLPLEFQQDIFHELRQEDVLLVLARGLGLLRLVTNLLHSYDAAGHNLVILVGADDRENDWIGESLAEHAAVSGSPKCRGMQLVNTDMTNVASREKMYKRGGICSITSRILIVDFLSGLLDPATVTGLVILHADRVAATSLEAFIVRIYRQKNKKGFLKAFSDQPEPFTTGYQPLTSILRNLFLRKPILYPRFHVAVAKSLEGKRKAEVIELEVPMTEAMRDIQNAVLECVEVSISELKKMNSGTIEMEDWNLDSALHRSFDLMVRRQLDPVWHRVSFRTKMIVRDLTMLRTILHSLLSLNAVDFNKYLDTVLAASSPPPNSSRKDVSPWLFLDAAHTLFDSAKRRVYTGKITDGPIATAEQDVLHPVLEELPKWGLLAEILEEIERDTYFNPRPDEESSGAILIMCADQGTCRQLREYLQTMRQEAEEDRRAREADEFDDGESKVSARYMMRRKLRYYLQWKRDFAKVSNSLFAANEKEIDGTAKKLHGPHANRGRAPPNKRRRIRGGGEVGAGPGRTAMGAVGVAGDKDSHIQALIQDLDRTNFTEDSAAAKVDLGADPLDDMDDYYELYDMNDLVLIHPYDSDMDDHLLEEIKPRYVIMYEPDAAFIRRIEVYRSSHSNRQVRVYFMYYGGSVEEQRYLSAVRREKDSFTRLIRERGNMAMTFTHDSDNMDPQESFLRTVNTRIAGGGRLTATAEPPRIVVDVREFRSSLPSLCHGRNMVVIPCMLTVGDYVLTPDVCVERKSISDLISSFNNGRLYNQAETMLQHYKSPMLLIEFDAQKAFTLEPFADLTSSVGNKDMVGTDLQSKLVLLTLAFPRLRIIWSSSPYQTAEIFEELKNQQDEPDPIKAVQTGLEHGEDPETRTFSQVPQDMLRCVPGVSNKALNKLILEYENVLDVANARETVLADLIGKENARQIRAFFDRSVWEDGGAELSPPDNHASATHQAVPPNPSARRFESKGRPRRIALCSLLFPYPVHTMRSQAAANMEHRRVSRPQHIGPASQHGSRPRETVETDEEDEAASYIQSPSKNGMVFTVAKGEMEDTKNKSAAPGCVTTPDPMSGSQVSEHGDPTFPRAEISAISDFSRRSQNDRNAIELHIRKLISKDGTAKGKAKLVAKQDRFGQLRIWCNEKLQQLEERKGKNWGSARTLFPQYYSVAEEDAWLRKTYSAWLGADEEDKSHESFTARTATAYPTLFTQVGSQYDGEDQDDEEMIQIKPELEDDDDHERTEATYNFKSTSNFTPSAHTPLRKAARTSNAYGNIREPSTPESDKIYYAQQQANHVIKRKREAEAHVRATKVKREDEEGAASDAASDVSSRQPLKNYVTVGLNGHFNGAKIMPQNLQCSLPDGKVIRVVRRAWVWDENGRMVVYPPF
ncbi:hypothetical protein AC579_3586 [Pseudocercospora musae]|uniref:ERCC4 domain-containing protein n=1 Tax=Pseudocercospora musae TaxID=113226 RepID=A0A139IW25_9PEZI|nr:hypothetical protein AC579_3586 [Pseudocercospora musae]